MSLAAGRAPAATGGSGPERSPSPASSAAPCAAAPSPAERTDVLLSEVAELAALLCGAAAGVVVDCQRGRQHVRAWTAASEPKPAAEETISPHVVAGDRALVVPDLGGDPRFADGPLARAGWRSSAGVPIRSAGGEVVGTLCVLDSVRRDLTGDQLDGMHRLARLAAGHFELERTATELSEQEDAQADHYAEPAAADRRLSGPLDGIDPLMSVRDNEMRDRLVESGRRWRRLLEQAPVGLIEADTDGIVLTVNARLCSLLGRTEDETIGRTIAEVTRPTAAADHASALADVVSGRTQEHLAKRVYTHNSGAEIPVRVNLVALRDDNGEAERLLVVVTDRSMEEVAKVTMDSALAQLSRERDSASALLAALSHGYIYTVDDGVIAEVNEALCELTGFSRAELVGATAPYPFWPAEATASYAKKVLLLRADEGGETELDFVRKDGSRFTAGITFRAVRNSDGAVTGFVSLVHDVTARRAAEAAVAASEQLLAEAQRQAQVGSWSLDLTTSVLTWSDQMFVLVGVPPRSIVPSPADFLTRLHPDDLRAYREAFEAGIRAGGSHTSEHRIVRPDGTVRHVYGTAEVETDPTTGRAVRVRGSAQDVTDARQREADLAAQAEKLTAIGKASHAVLTDPDPRGAICAAARTVSGAISVTLLEVRDGSLVPTAASGVDPGEIRRSLDDPRSMLVRVQRSGLPIMIDDTERHEITELPGARAAIVVPVVAAGKPADVNDFDVELPASSIPVVIGVLAVALTRAPQRRVLELLDVLEVLAGEASLAIDRSDLHTKLLSQARTDPLTGLANRRRWDESAPLELARAARTKNPLSMALIDLDHFKAYNDTHGHAAGDTLLRAVADAWGPQLRVADLLARYGGEEFAVVLPNCDSASAKRLLDRLRESVPGEASASAGIAEWNGSETTHELLERADTALYRAKAAGRNCVIVAMDVDQEKH